MKIAIISDTHNNITNLKKVLDYCAKNEIAKIICCGDLASLETLDFLNDNFSPSSDGEIYFTFGNMDDGHLKNYPFTDTYKRTRIFKGPGEATIGNKRVAFTHFPSVARKLCDEGSYDFVFYGHTHKPWEEKMGNCKMLNPGNVAGELYPPTFAVWETENDHFELVRIHSLD